MGLAVIQALIVEDVARATLVFILGAILIGLINIISEWLANSVERSLPT